MPCPILIKVENIFFFVGQEIVEACFRIFICSQPILNSPACHSFTLLLAAYFIYPFILSRCLEVHGREHTCDNYSLHHVRKLIF